ncbi:hypothetical protein CISIN_1g0424492mg, partial [Citrus sinensis]
FSGKNHVVAKRLVANDSISTSVHSTCRVSHARLVHMNRGPQLLTIFFGSPS